MKTLRPGMLPFTTLRTTILTFNTTADTPKPPGGSQKDQYMSLINMATKLKADLQQYIASENELSAVKMPVLQQAWKIFDGIEEYIVHMKIKIDRIDVSAKLAKEAFDAGDVAEKARREVSVAGKVLLELGKEDRTGELRGGLIREIEDRAKKEVYDESMDRVLKK